MRTVELDSQILNAIQSCKELWNLRFLQHWSTNSKPEPFEKGDLGHTATEYYYRALSVFKEAGKEPDKLQLIREARIFAAKKGAEMELPIQEVDRILNILDRYFHFYLQQDDFDIVAVEQPFSKILYESEEEGLRIVYIGIIDLLTNTRVANNMVWDHKTQGSSYQLDELDNQFIGYAWAFDSNWVVANKIGLQKTLKDEDRFKRQILSVSDPLKTMWREEAIESVREALWAIDNKRFKKNISYCKCWGGCTYRQVCKTQDSDVKRQILMRDFYVSKPWNPYNRG